MALLPWKASWGARTKISYLDSGFSLIAVKGSFRRRNRPNHPNLLLSQILDEANRMLISLIERMQQQP
jgi:hypothetical protein